MPLSARRSGRSHLMASSSQSNCSDADPNPPPIHRDISLSQETSHAGVSCNAAQLGRAVSHRTKRPNHAAAARSGREHHHDYDMHAGAEPGINPLSGSAIAEYSHFQQECVIDVIDYDCENVTFRRFTNEKLVEMLNEPSEHPHASAEEASLPPRMVRWINVGGVDWNVLSALAVKYGLHSLALEDILHERGHNHSKADYYPGHLFIRILSHSLELEDLDKFYEDGISHNSDDSGTHPKTTPAPAPKYDLEGGGFVVLTTQGKNSDADSKIIPTLLRTPESSSAQPSVKGKDKKKRGIDSFHQPFLKRFSALSGFGGEARERDKRAIEALKKGDRVAVKHEPMFIFLLPNGTVISIHTSPSLDFTSPIAERLHRPDSILRVSEDASLLVQSLLDLIVDCILEVIDEYQVKISQLEHDMLLNPVMRSVRSLHILSGDMIMHKRTLDPIKTLIFGLRHYDVQRSQAIADNMAHERRMRRDRGSQSSIEKGSSESDSKSPATTEDKAYRRRQNKHEMLKETRTLVSDQPPPGLRDDSLGRDPRDFDHVPTDRRVHGYFSFKAKVYLADVSDHMDFAITSLEMFAGISENLLNYAFNIASYDMNVIMNRLTLTTIIFLPLTLLTGYFGMNFTEFWSVQGHSDFLFWKIALPAMAVLIPLLMYRDIKEFVGYVKRRTESRREAVESKRKMA